LARLLNGMPCRADAFKFLCSGAAVSPQPLKAPGASLKSSTGDPFSGNARPRRDTHDTVATQTRCVRHAAEKFLANRSRAVHVFGDFRLGLVISY
jgi:hypothetical protein